MKKRIVAVAVAAFAIVATVLGTTASASETDIVNVDNLQSKGLQSTGALKVVDPDKGWDVDIESSDFTKLGADISTLALALNELGVITVQNADKLKQELTTKLNELGETTTQNADKLKQELTTELDGEKSVREAVDKEIYKILGMADGTTEIDESGNVIERDADGNITRTIKTEVTVNGTAVTVTRYDASQDPAVKIDEVSYDAATGKAVTKEGVTVDPIILTNVPAVGLTTVTITNADSTQSTIVFTNGFTDDSIEKYLEEHYNFSGAQLTDVRKLIDDATAAGATTQQEIIQYITNHTITQEVRDTMIETLTAPSIDNEFGVSMSEIKYYLENKVPPASTELIATVIEKYLTLAGLTSDEVAIVVNAMNDPATNINNDGVITKEELIAYLTALTDEQGNPKYTAEEIDRLAAAYVFTPTVTEVNDYYRAFTPEEVNNISDAMAAIGSTGASSAIQVQATSDVQLSVLDRIANEEAARKQDIADLNANVDSKVTTINNEMNTLSSDVDNKLTTLTDTMNTNMSNLSSDVDNKITTLTNNMNTNMSNLSADVNDKITTLTNTTNGKMSSLSDELNGKINTLTDTVNTNITNLNESVDTKITTLTNTMNTNMGNLSDDLNGKITTLSDTMDTNISNLSDDVNGKITTLEGTMNTNINNLSTDMDEKITTLTNTTNTNISNLSTDVDNRLSALNSTVNTDLKNYINHGGENATYDGVRAKYTPQSGNNPATVTFSPIVVE